MNSFQTILLIIFAVLAIFATIVFSGFLSTSENTEAGTLMVWGTLPQRPLDVFFDAFSKQKLTPRVRYIEHSATTFDRDLVEALADAKGPDLIIMSEDLILRHQGKVAKIPYDILPERTFTDAFIEEGSLYLAPDGVVGLPLLVDPLMFFWNKDLLTNAEIAEPPRTWEQLLGLTSRLTKRDQGGNITQSAVSFGGFVNVSHAKEILAALLFQVEQPIVHREPGTNAVQLRLGGDKGQAGAEAAIRFYTEFSNPVKEDVYTWNNALRNSRELFAANQLVFFPGKFSEIGPLKSDNPHLNFDVTQLPQRENASVRATFGTLYAVSPLKSSVNPEGALKVALSLAQTDNVRSLSQTLSLPPARRDLLSAGSADPELAVAYRSAVIARGWLDPNPDATSALFQKSIESVVSGVSSAGDAIIKLASQLVDLLPNSND